MESLGARPCSELVAASKDDQALYAGFGAWIGGYLTAANAYEDDTFDLTPWQPIEFATAQVTAGCKSEPESSVAQAVVGYVNYLKTNRLRSSSELIRVRAGQKAVFLYKDVLTDIRARLTEKGATITDPEGTYGATFGQAVMAYQQRNNLGQSGLPDTPTLVHLYR